MLGGPAGRGGPVSGAPAGRVDAPPHNAPPASRTPRGPPAGHPGAVARSACAWRAGRPARSAPANTRVPCGVRAERAGAVARGTPTGRADPPSTSGPTDTTTPYDARTEQTGRMAVRAAIGRADTPSISAPTDATTPCGARTAQAGTITCHAPAEQSRPPVLVAGAPVGACVRRDRPLAGRGDEGLRAARNRTETVPPATRAAARAGAVPAIPAETASGARASGDAGRVWSTPCLIGSPPWSAARAHMPLRQRDTPRGRLYAIRRLPPTPAGEWVVDHTAGPAGTPPGEARGPARRRGAGARGPCGPRGRASHDRCTTDGETGGEPTANRRAEGKPTGQHRSVPVTAGRGPEEAPGENPWVSAWRRRRARRSPKPARRTRRCCRPSPHRATPSR